MKLVPASSPGMLAAHSHTYVRNIVQIIVQYRDLLSMTASIIRDHTVYNEEFAQDLEAFCQNVSRPDDDGRIVLPEYAVKLTEILNKLYQQPEEKIKYQRGAIVERLVCELIRCRYNKQGDQCLVNHRLVENYCDMTEQMDVIAFSSLQKRIEGYECKVNSLGFKQCDVINLSDLRSFMVEKDYSVDVGFVSLDSDHKMRLKCKKMELPSFIRLYGLDSIEDLGNSAR